MGETFQAVQGRCPACGNATLFLAAGGYVTCGFNVCPRPAAASDLLELAGERRHKIEFGDVGWTIEHPLSERNGSLFDCKVQWSGRDTGLRGRYWLRTDAHGRPALGERIDGAQPYSEGEALR